MPVEARGAVRVREAAVAGVAEEAHLARRSRWTRPSGRGTRRGRGRRGGAAREAVESRGRPRAATFVKRGSGYGDANASAGCRQRRRHAVGIAAECHVGDVQQPARPQVVGNEAAAGAPALRSPLAPSRLVWTPGAVDREQARVLVVRRRRSSDPRPSAGSVDRAEHQHVMNASAPDLAEPARSTASQQLRRSARSPRMRPANSSSFA